MRHNHGLRAQSGSPWTPALMVTDLWLDAADATTITTISGAVSEWRDKSGNGRHVSQATSANRPAYQATGLNSKPTISFDGANDFLKNASYQPSTSGGLTCFLVFRRSVASGALVNVKTATNFEIGGSFGSGYTDITITGHGGGTGVGFNSGDSSNANAILAVQYDGAGSATSDYIARLNGIAQPIASSGALGYVTENGFSLGARPNQSLNFLNGQISELIFVDSQISANVIQSIEGYLAHKWGLAASLPAYHPYKNTAPQAGNQSFYNVSLLLNGDSTNGAQNNTFVDSSGNSRSVTRGGNITQGSFSPYGPKSGSSYDPALHGGSAYFDGSGDFVTLGSLTSTYLSGDFTIEGWVWLDNQISQMFFNTIPHPSFGISLNRDGSGQTSLYIGNGTSWLTLDFRSSGRIPLYAWTHVAVVRSSNAITIYHNGIAQGTTTANMPSGFGQTAYVGTYNGATGENVKGYFSDYRITRSAVYTSNFTPPTSPVSAIANTEVLLRFTSGGIVDATGNNVLETVGDAQISTTQKKFGTGALYFDGNGDDAQLRSPATLFELGSGNFTMEAWVYVLGDAGGNFIAIGQADGATVAGSSWLFSATSARSSRIHVGEIGYNVPHSNVTQNQWVHVALVRNGTVLRQYHNGILSGELTGVTGSVNTGATTYGPGVGSGVFANVRYFFNGYIDDLRITKGVARYTANFTPPSSAFPLS